METPVLTKKQRQKALSSKKNQIKSIKNVLQSPYEKYWPLLDEEDEGKISEYLERLLPVIRNKKVTLKYSEIKKLSKEQRVEQRKLSNLSTPNLIRNSIAIGLNTVTRHMERNTAACILLSSKVDPPILTNHITVLSSANSIPLLIMRNLEDISEKVLGFKIITCAFLKQNSSNYFNTLLDLLLEISHKHPFSKPKILSKNTETMDDLTPLKIVKQNVNNDNLYLIRLSEEKRVFIPEKSKQKNTNVKSWDEFISFKESDGTRNNVVPTISGGNTNNMEIDTSEFYIDIKPMKVKPPIKEIPYKPKTKSDIRYIPLKVKRIQGNPNRPKKLRKKNKEKKN